MINPLMTAPEYNNLPILILLQSPNFQCELFTNCRILKRSGRWILFVSFLAEIISIYSQRRAIWLFIGKIRYDRLAEHISSHQFSNSFDAPDFVEYEFEVKAVSLLNQIELWIELWF